MMLLHDKEIYKNLHKSAEKFRKKKQFEKAIKEYEYILSLYPGEKKLYNTVGDLYYQIRDQNNAVKYYSKYAEALENNNYPLQAIAIYKKINRINNGNIQILKKLAELYTEQDLIAESISIYLNLADIYKRQGSVKESISAYEKISYMQPDNQEVIHILIEQYIKEGMKSQAIVKYLGFAKLMKMRNEWENAKLIYDKIFELDPENIDASICSLNMHIHKRDYASAGKFLIQLAENNKHFEEILANIEIKNLLESKEIYETLLKIKPESIVLKEKFLFTLVKLNDNEGSLSNFCSIIEYYKTKQNFKRIIKLSNDIIKLKPEFWFVYETLIEIYDIMGQKHEKIDTLKELSCKYCESGKYHEALNIYRKLREYYPHKENPLSSIISNTPEKNQDHLEYDTIDIDTESLIDTGNSNNIKEMPHYFYDLYEEADNIYLDNMFKIHDLNKNNHNFETDNMLFEKITQSIKYDIRNPLMGIIGFLSLLKDASQDRLKEQYIKNAFESSKILLDNIDNLMDFYHLDNGNFKLNLEDTLITKLAEQAIYAVNLYNQNKDTEIILNIEPNMPLHIKTDFQRLKKILISFLSNSVKYTENSQVEMKISFKPIIDNKASFIFSIRDTEYIIPSEYQEKLNNIFDSKNILWSDKDQKAKQGLLLANFIIKKMGGKISISGMPDTGTEILINIEAEYEPDNIIDKKTFENINRIIPIDGNDMRSEHRHIIMGSPRILIAEDLNINMIFLIEVVHAIIPDAEIIEAKDEREIKDLIKGSPVDIILMDIDMPVTDGLEITKLIRKKEKEDEIKKPALIIGLCSNANEKYKKKCLNAGMNGLMKKPIDHIDLYNILKKIWINNDDIAI